MDAKELFELVTSRIPHGDYCYTGHGKNIKICPFWGSDPDKHDQECGFCRLTGEKDWIDSDRNAYYPIRQNEQAPPVVGLESESDEQGGGCHIPLLWDQVKNCGINDYTDDEIDEMIQEAQKDEQKEED